MKPVITYDQHTYRALSDERILKRFKEKIESRYGQPTPGNEPAQEIYLGADIVKDILSEIYRDLKNERK
jgi:hypothetical protein